MVTHMYRPIAQRPVHFHVRHIGGQNMRKKIVHVLTRALVCKQLYHRFVHILTPKMADTRRCAMCNGSIHHFFLHTEFWELAFVVLLFPFQKNSHVEHSLTNETLWGPLLHCEMVLLFLISELRIHCVELEQISKSFSLHLFSPAHATTSNHSKVFDLRASVLACCYQDFLDISEATRELSYVDLDLLGTANLKLCFFVNVMNLLLAHASLYHIYQQLISKVRTP